MRRLVALALAAAMTLQAGPAPAASRVTIAGTLSNGTAGAPLPDGLPVTAVQLGPGGEEVAREGATASGGAFHLEGFDNALGTRYLVAAEYLQVTYSTVVDNPSSSPTITAALTVFEVIEDDSVISVLSDTLTVVPGEGNVLEVLQLLRVRNASDRTFVGRPERQGRTVLHLPVPPGAYDVLPERGVTPRIDVAVAEGFAAADPILPGETSVSYLYKVQVPRSGWTMSRAVFYPTERIDVLAGEGLEVSAADLAFAEEAELGGRTYRRHRGGPFTPGSVLEAAIAPVAAPSGGLGWGLAVIIAAVVAAATGVPILLRRRGGRPGGIPLPSERERLVEEIAALDEAHAGGSLPDGEYATARERLKSRLAALTGELAAAPPPRTRPG